MISSTVMVMLGLKRGDSLELNGSIWQLENVVCRMQQGCVL